MAEEGGGGDEILPRVIEKFSREFDSMFEAFASKHAYLFACAGNSGDTEHSLEYTKIHRDFCGLFEAAIEEFLDENGSSSRAFFRECQQVIEQEVGGEKQWFVEFILAGTEYSRFYGLMRNHAKMMIATGQLEDTSSSSFSKEGKEGEQADESEGRSDKK